MIKSLKVLELASVLAGPGVGQFFAELGADVIKVENLNTNGDITRSWKGAGEQTDDRSAYFCSVNWGKKSLAVDLNSVMGKEIIYRLIADTDIVIASYKPGDDEKLGVDYQTLSRLNPGLIYGQISGYGPHNSRVGYDAVIQAEAGFMIMNGESGGPSLKMPVAMVDILAGHHLKEGILLALLEKTQTGKGRLVEVSLIQAAVSSLANQASNWLIANKLPQKHGSAHPNIAPYGDVFKTRDGEEIILAVGSDRQFQDLCKILDLEELSENPLFINNQNRVENRKTLNNHLSDRIGNFSSQSLLDQIHGLKIPAGIIQNLAQVFKMPEAMELLFKDSAGLTGVKNFISPGFNPDQDSSGLLSPPHLGQHTEEILKALGF